MSRIHGSLARVAVPILLLLAATACGGGGGGIKTTLKEWSVTADESSAPAGEVTFDVSNDGANVHEFVVFKTDLAEDALPTIEEEGETVIDEEASGLELVDEIEDIAPGSSPSLTVTVDAGKYVLVCNIPGHYGQGMHTSFTVS